MSFGAAGPSAPCLLYLFADEVVPHSTVWSQVNEQYSVKLPCHRKHVQLGPLERLMFTWAFWHLHSNELIELGHLDDEEEDEGTIGVCRTQYSDGAYGFEADLLAVCQSEPDPIKTVIRRWARGHVLLPIFAVVGAVQAEAASCGLLELKGHDVDPLAADRQLHLEAEDCQHIADLQPLFQDLLDEWTTFTTDKPDWAFDLEEQCRRGLLDLRNPPSTSSFASLITS
jgi:hypothetical protein